MADDRAYRVHVQYLVEEQSFVASAPELSIEHQAPTRAEAIAGLETAIESAMEQAAVSGDHFPRPIDLVTEGGQVQLDLAAPVWRDLVVHAAAQEMEPAELALQLLTRGLAQMDGRRRRPPKKAEPKAEAATAEGETDEDAQPAEPKKDANRRRRRGRGGGGRREGYRPDMEDQANFLAYVRDQERGGRNRR